MSRAKHIVFLDWNTMEYRKGELSPRSFAALGTQIDVFPRTAPEETVRNIGDADVVICNKVLITEEVLQQCPGVQYIGLLATGFNNVDLAAAGKRGIPVCNAGSYSTDAVTQLVFAYIFDWYQRVALYSMDVRLGEWAVAPTFSYFPHPTGELRGKTMAIIGYGAIGKNVARIAEAFGMQVVIATRTQPESCPYRLVTTDEAFALADVLSIHCPLNEQTKGLVCARTLGLMKPTAILINTSRGGVVCEQDLADALNDGTLAAAYLDVLNEEPMNLSTPLQSAKNCTITPHIGWTPLEARKRLMDIAEDNLRGWLNGSPQHVVNREYLTPAE